MIIRDFKHYMSPSYSQTYMCVIDFLPKPDYLKYGVFLY